MKGFLLKITMKNQLSDIDQEILRLLGEGKKIKEITIGTLSTKTIYERLKKIRLQFRVKTNKELLEAYKKFLETPKSA